MRRRGEEGRRIGIGGDGRSEEETKRGQEVEKRREGEE